MSLHGANSREGFDLMLEEGILGRHLALAAVDTEHDAVIMKEALPALKEDGPKSGCAIDVEAFVKGNLFGLCMSALFALWVCSGHP
jgi:hypothetical protein